MQIIMQRTECASHDVTLFSGGTKL